MGFLEDDGKVSEKSARVGKVGGVGEQGTLLPLPHNPPRTRTRGLWGKRIARRYPSCVGTAAVPPHQRLSHALTSPGISPDPPAPHPNAAYAREAQSPREHEQCVHHALTVDQVALIPR